LTEEEKERKRVERNKRRQTNRLSASYTTKTFIVTATDMWRHFNFKKVDKLPKEKYVGLIGDLFLEISKKIIFERHVLVLPHLLGTIQLVSKRITTPFKRFFRRNGKVKAEIREYLEGNARMYSIKWINSHTKDFYNKRYYTFSNLNSKRARKLGIGGSAITKYVMDTVNSDTEKLIDLIPKKK